MIRPAGESKMSNNVLGRYDLIPAEAWAEFDRQNQEFQEARRAQLRRELDHFRRPDEANFRAAIRVAINDLHEIAAIGGPCARYRASHLIAILKLPPDIHWCSREYIQSNVEWCAVRTRKCGKRTIITEDDAEDWLRNLPELEAGADARLPESPRRRPSLPRLRFCNGDGGGAA
jgi:hypothetical protein